MDSSSCVPSLPSQSQTSLRSLSHNYRKSRFTSSEFGLKRPLQDPDSPGKRGGIWSVSDHLQNQFSQHFSRFFLLVFFFSLSFMGAVSVLWKIAAPGWCSPSECNRTSRWKRVWGKLEIRNQHNREPLRGSHQSTLEIPAWPSTSARSGCSSWFSSPSPAVWTRRTSHVGAPLSTEAGRRLHSWMLANGQIWLDVGFWKNLSRTATFRNLGF